MSDRMPCLVLSLRWLVLLMQAFAYGVEQKYLHGPSCIHPQTRVPETKEETGERKVKSTKHDDRASRERELPSG